MRDSRDVEGVERDADELDDGTAQESDAGLGLEAPEADTAEQRAEVLQRGDEPVTARSADRNGEADPADTAEQRRVVVEDEEDYR
ncbi:hypothetical protein K7862_04930 [Streptomyces sp. PLK6-54]|uniref:DUF5709 domain-containing protein n=1 Tax=Actinacidiphila acidipaludis TaxID=2873382 RepID=A0ABS7Q1G3_9ACTN|nr:hypothetical protein [Streptomyces acidipaludis]